MNTKALHKISYGLYIVGARKEENLNAQTANTVVQISADPISIAVSINKQNLTHEYIRSGGHLAISVLEQETPLSMIGKFGFKSGRDTDKLSDTSYSLTDNGLPYLTENTLAYLEAKVITEMDASTHTIFLGQVSAAEVLKDGAPMTYSYYHQVKRGTTPSTAPTYQK